ncbi:type I glyceraldehyde-3-phosphate dehydrogenase [Desulfomonile tiedjei]|uniref:Glyceraldehyde-3-phosphate dehydrogenase n=1 Tax=Desulfomonile tiedjei (strain ATCC 49306 / DSM 6799 / DCB-1) TaxID=706587 RepID=I4C0S0_DESTA|nr:type I glyceraldehyde-3-phosphate dehydrogenase [Desulfomonile tiedjei]AFM23161.1 glyceraldehyde-3-phosphate dehydrogenase, type I [Desulfomonile tiedjei DSM 6799]
MARIAINGMGRIGRASFKIIMDEPQLELVAVNDLIPADDLAYLLVYDSVYRKFSKQVKSRQEGLVVGEKTFKVFNERNPEKLPWGKLNVDIVLECTGLFTKRDDMEKHIRAGAKRVILSAPSKSDDITTVVYGVNAPDPANVTLISTASCTTNCITPIMEIIGRRIGIKKAMMSTVHAYTGSQALVDGPHKKPRRGRAAAVNLVPTSTGAAEATTKVLTQLSEKFDGVAIRGPVPAGSIADIVVLTERPTSVDEIISIFKEEVQTPRYKNVVGVTEDPIVSSDIIQDPRASVIDLSMTRVVDGDLVNIMSWYDNEWGYANQMVREAARIAGQPQ